MTSQTYFVGVDQSGVATANPQQDATRFSYDGTEPKNKRRSVSSSLLSEDSHLNSSGRRKLSANSRDLLRNYAVVGWAARKHLDFVASHSLHIRSPDRGLNNELSLIFEDWGEECDVSERLNFHDCIRSLEMRRVFDGDVGILYYGLDARADLAGRIQAIESERIRDPERVRQGRKTRSDWVHGVRVNQQNKALEFAIHRRNGKQMEFERRVSAANMHLLGYFDRLDQVRGVSPMASALNMFRDSYEFHDLAVAKGKVANLFGLVFYRDAESAPAPTEEEPGSEDSAGRPRYNVDYGMGPFSLDLDPYDRAEFLENKTGAPDHAMMIRLTIQLAILCLDLPWCFLDTNAGTYGWRAAMLLYQKSAKSKRRGLRRWLKRTHRWKMAQLIQSGQLVLPRTLDPRSLILEWVPDGIPWWDTIRIPEVVTTLRITAFVSSRLPSLYPGAIVMTISTTKISGLDTMSRAEYFESLAAEGASYASIGTMHGVASTTVKTLMRLTKLPAAWREHVRSGRISASQARFLLRFNVKVLEALAADYERAPAEYNSRSKFEARSLEVATEAGYRSRRTEQARSDDVKDPDQLSPIERARYLESFAASGLTNDRIGELFGRTGVWVREWRRVLQLNDRWQQLLDRGKLSQTLALYLLRFDSTSQQAILDDYLAAPKRYATRADFERRCCELGQQVERPQENRPYAERVIMKSKGRDEGLPKYQLHKASGRARVHINGKDHYLGKYNSHESLRLYDELIAAYIRDRPAEGVRMRVDELALLYVDYVQKRYRKDGELTSHAKQVALALRYIVKAYGTDRAADFGPVKLKRVRRDIAGCCVRDTANKYTRLIASMFEWAVSEELLPITVYQSLTTLSPLRRSEGRSNAPIGPVSTEHVEAVEPFVTGPIWGMIRLQQATAARPGEVRIIRPCDIDKKHDVWTYTPQTHKTDYCGKERPICIGPKGQAICREFWPDDDQEYFFKPTVGHGKFYVADSYNGATRRACRRAGIPVWHPNQLRHSKATLIRERFGIEVASTVLGHSSLDITEIYAERNMELARDAMRKVG